MMMSTIFRWGAPDFVREFMKNIPYRGFTGILFWFGPVHLGSGVSQYGTGDATPDRIGKALVSLDDLGATRLQPGLE